MLAVGSELDASLGMATAGAPSSHALGKVLGAGRRLRGYEASVLRMLNAAGMNHVQAWLVWQIHRTKRR